MIKNIRFMLVAVLILATFMANAIVVSAEQNNFEIVLEDVTRSDIYSVKKGEAKILVSIRGASGNVKIIDTALKFAGDLSYSAIEYIGFVNNPPQTYLSTSVKGNEINSGIVITDGKAMTDDLTPLYLLTFKNESGGKVSLEVDDNENKTYCRVNDIDKTLFQKVELLDVSASEVEVEEKTLKIKQAKIMRLLEVNI